MIGPMTEADLPEVLAIEAASFPEPWPAEVFLAELRHGEERSVCRVFRDPTSGRVLGSLIYWRVVDELHLHNVAVRPDARGRGIGRALMEHLLADAAAGATRLVSLEVRRSNLAARALYERLGFGTIAVRPRYYRDNDEDALVMEKELPAACPPMASIRS